MATKIKRKATKKRVRKETETEYDKRNKQTKVRVSLANRDAIKDVLLQLSTQYKIMFKELNIKTLTTNDAIAFMIDKCSSNEFCTTMHIDKDCNYQRIMDHIANVITQQKEDKQ